jgi:hypothetical protein
VLRHYEAAGWRSDRAVGRRPNGLTGLAFDYLSEGGPVSAERLRRLPLLVTVVEAVTSEAA